MNIRESIAKSQCCCSDNYVLLCELGSGSYGRVYKAVCKTTDTFVAIKIIDLEKIQSCVGHSTATQKAVSGLDALQHEVALMSNLKHDNLTRFKCSFVHSNELWIVMNFAGRSCHDILKSCPQGIKDESLLATIVKSVLLALQYMHKNGYIHRDVKPANIMIGDMIEAGAVSRMPGTIQLADFGVSNTLLEEGAKRKHRSTFTGTPPYMAPEFFMIDDLGNSIGHNEKVDSWSLGITLLELAYGKHPYTECHGMKHLIQLILSESTPCGADYKDASYRFSKQFHSFVRKCLRRDATKRYSIQKLLDHRFLRSSKNNDYVYQQVNRLSPKQQITHSLEPKIDRTKETPQAVALDPIL